MRYIRTTAVLVIVFAAVFSVAYAQTPTPAPAGGGRGGRGGRGGAAAPQTPAAPGAPAPAAAAQAPRGGGGGGGSVIMTLNTTAWSDGGMIPLRYTQAGPEISPTIQWSGAPANTVSFVLIFQDADSLVANSTDGLLHWMVWNIPATAANLAQAQADGFEAADQPPAPAGAGRGGTPAGDASATSLFTGRLPAGARQMSVSGARYRGPGAPASGPIHHYIMELYALDTMLDMKVPAQGPQEANPNIQMIRTQIMAAMVGHIRGKAAYVGLFHRPQ